MYIYHYVNTSIGRRKGKVYEKYLSLGGRRQEGDPQYNYPGLASQPSTIKVKT